MTSDEQIARARFQLDYFQRHRDSHHLSPITNHFAGLPHREPFLFVRELIACNPGKSAHCATSFESDDPIFAGHFPGNPLVPGVILTEALAQTAGIAAAAAYPENARPLFLLSAIRTMKFLRAVRPAQRIVLHAEKLAQVNENMQFKVEGSVNGTTVVEGQLVLSIAEKLGNPSEV